ncbi:MAG: hypothetical protein DDT19_01165 [Syntrophomonadaceae bacterium]|nr:hypothetical protein [Bacillota bacterium]
MRTLSGAPASRYTGVLAKTVGECLAVIVTSPDKLSGTRREAIRVAFASPCVVKALNIGAPVIKILSEGVASNSITVPSATGLFLMSITRAVIVVRETPSAGIRIGSAVRDILVGSPITVKIPEVFRR